MDPSNHGFLWIVGGARPEREPVLIGATIADARDHLSCLFRVVYPDAVSPRMALRNIALEAFIAALAFDVVCFVLVAWHSDGNLEIHR